MKTNSTLFVDYLCIPAELVFCYWFSKHSPLDPNLQKYQISHKFTAFVCLKLILPFSILLLGFQMKNIVVHNDYYTIWIWHTRSKCKLVVLRDPFILNICSFCICDNILCIFRNWIKEYKQNACLPNSKMIVPYLCAYCLV